MNLRGEVRRRVLQFMLTSSLAKVLGGVVLDGDLWLGYCFLHSSLPCTVERDVKIVRRQLDFLVQCFVGAGASWERAISGYERG